MVSALALGEKRLPVTTGAPAPLKANCRSYSLIESAKINALNP